MSDMGRSFADGSTLSPSIWYVKYIIPLARAGYWVVSLTDGEARKPLYVHRLVAEAFIGPIPPGMTVNHKDLVKTNNRVGNLEIVTRAENNVHAWENGAMPRGTRNGHAKLTEAQVVQVRLLKGVRTTRAVGAEFGVSCCVVSLIQNRKIWRHVP